MGGGFPHKVSYPFAWMSDGETPVKTIQPGNNEWINYQEGGYPSRRGSIQETCLEVVDEEKDVREVKIAG